MKTSQNGQRFQRPHNINAPTFVCPECGPLPYFRTDEASAVWRWSHSRQPGKHQRFINIWAVMKTWCRIGSTHYLPSRPFRTAFAAFIFPFRGPYSLWLTIARAFAESFPEAFAVILCLADLTWQFAFYTFSFWEVPISLKSSFSFHF